MSAQIVQFVLLIFILRWLAYKPILRMLEKRTKTIEKSLSDAQRIEKNLAEGQAERERMLAETRREAESIVADARSAAETVKAKLLDETKEKMEALRRQTEIEAESTKYNVIICDRGFDNYLYMERKFGTQQKYIDLVLRHLIEHPYILIVNVPITDNILRFDNLRSTDIEFQKDIDRRLTEFMEKYGIKHLVLPEPVMPYREDWIYRIMKSLKPHIPGLI